MTKKIATAVLSFLWTVFGQGHITPNVELVKKGEFLRQSLPGAVRFFEKRMAWSGEDGIAVKRATGWRPSDESSKVYVGRDAEKRLIGSAVFLWMPSQHGPVGIGVAFDPKGTIRRATVTDVSAEPLAWVRPLLEGEGQALRGLEEFPASASPKSSHFTPPGAGAMTRYYAEVIAEAVARAQAIERVSRESEKP